MANSSDIFAAWVEPDKHILHRTQGPGGRVWHRSKIRGLYCEDCYVLSRGNEPPHGAYILKRHGFSYVHYEIVESEDV